MPQRINRRTFRRLRAGPPVLTFDGEHEFLSNFYPSPVYAPTPHGPFNSYSLYPTVEHAYHSLKTTVGVEKQQILDAPSPGIAKRLGRRVSLRPDWDDIKVEAMEGLVYLKFAEHEPLLEALLLTGTRELIEGNFWGDSFWGVYNGVGRNELGKVLMRVRQRLREERE